MEENVIQEESNENVDKLLESVSDEYLSKKKRTRIISYSIISTIVLAISIIIIVMSCVRVDLKPEFLGRALSYKVTIANKDVLSLDENSSDYKEFNEEFIQSFQTKYLTALFTGRLGGYTIDETSDNFYTSNSSTTPSSALKQELGENYVKVEFAEEKDVVNNNGSVYRSKLNTNKTFKFKEMYFKLNTENKGEDTTLYLGGKTSTESGNTVTRILKVNVRTNTYNLYKLAMD